MFDRFNFSSGEYINRSSKIDVTINEKRAPTDDSVKLLAEMHDAARNNILSTLPVEVNGIKGKIVVYDKVGIWGARGFAVVYNINGKRYQEVFEILEEIVRDRATKDKITYDEAGVRLLIEEFSDRLSRALLSNLDLEDAGRLWGKR